jgi:hypothetical protein
LYRAVWCLLAVLPCPRGPLASPVETIFGGGCFLFPPLQFFFWQSFKTGSSTGGSTSPSRRAERTLKFTTEKVIGNGSFGVVYEARIIETGETVAIKKVLQDRRFKVGQGWHPAVGPVAVAWPRRGPSWTLNLGLRGNHAVAARVHVLLMGALSTWPVFALSATCPCSSVQIF